MKHRILPAIHVVICLAPSCMPAILHAQSDFATLRRELDADRDAMVKAAKGRPGMEDVKRLADATAVKLERFLEDRNGEDAANARLMLANVWLEVGASAKVTPVLAAFDPATTPPLALVAAAEIAARVGQNDLRERFVSAAVAATAPFEQRMALAIFLATRLVEIPRSDAIFAEAEKTAKDDEARAHVAWYRVNCLRAREDVDEDDWDRALVELAEKFPATYWGGIAKDLKRALNLKPGDPAINFVGRTLDDQPFALNDLRGKVVLVEFWSDHTDRTAPFLAKLKDEFGERGLAIVGVAAFDDPARAKAAAQGSGRTWPQLFDGRGPQTDAALRYGIERLPDFVLIDRKGCIAMMHPFLDDAGGRADLHDQVATCLDQK